MTERSIKIPGPDHPITIEANPDRVVVTLGGQSIADTTAALTLREAAYPAVQYIPAATSTWRRSCGATTPPTAPTKARRPTSASPPAGTAR